MSNISFNNAIAIAKQNHDSSTPDIFAVLSIHASGSVVLYATLGVPYLDDVPAVTFPALLATGPSGAREVVGSPTPGLSTRLLSNKGYVGLLSTNTLGNLAPGEIQPFAWNQAMIIDVSLWSTQPSPGRQYGMPGALSLEIEALDGNGQIVSQVIVGCQESSSMIFGVGRSLCNLRCSAIYSVSLYR